MKNEKTPGSPEHVEPILAVDDIIRTVNYWHEVLGFPGKWTWGEPPTYGGVSWHGVSIQFSKDEKLASQSKGNTIFIKVRNLEELYNYHQKKNAVIVEPLENKPWGMAAYTVQDINGYYIIFAGALLSERKIISTELPSSVKIIARSPTIKEYQYLTSSVGWSMYTKDEVVAKLLTAPVYAVVAEDSASGSIVGCALLLGDNASFYYIKDVVVHSEWQSKHIGTAMMKQLTEWIKTNGADNSLVSLITPEGLAPFYRRFGFVPAFCMIDYIQQNNAEVH